MGFTFLHCHLDFSHGCIPLVVYVVFPFSVAASADFVVIGEGAIGGFVGVALPLCWFLGSFLVRQESLSDETELLSRGLTDLCSTDASFRQSISRDEVPQMFTESSECLRS